MYNICKKGNSDNPWTCIPLYKFKKYIYVEFSITNFIFKKLQNEKDIGNDRLQEKWVKEG